MRILITGFTRNRGGIETFAMNYIRAMRAVSKDIFFDLLGYEAQPAFAQELRQMGGQIFVLPSPRKAGAHQAMKDFFAVHADRYAALWCNKCDLADIGYLRMAARYGIPRRILHSHSSANMHSGLRRILYGSLHRLHKRPAARLATDLWACSDYAARWLFPAKAAESGRVEYIPNAVDLARFSLDLEARSRCRAQLGLGPETTAHLLVGRLSRVKNQAFALQVFDAVHKARPDSVLLLAGAGEMETELRRQAAGLSCAGAVRFLGMRSDVPQLLQAADSLWMPSLFEGFPVAAVEAQAAGLPVFAAQDGITRQVCLTEQFHFLPLSAGAGGWAEAILRDPLRRTDCTAALTEKGFALDTAARALYARLTAPVSAR